MNNSVNFQFGIRAIRKKLFIFQQFLRSWMVQNYCVWSQIMEIHIPSRMKKGYIIGRKVAPAENDLSYDE